MTPNHLGWQLLIGGAFAAALSTAPAQAQSTSQHRLSVSRHNTAWSTNVLIDNMFAAADGLLTTDNDGAGSGDVYCPHQFIRGASSVFSNTDGIIDSPGEADAILSNSTPGYVKIVNRIEYCGVTGTFTGCANSHSMMMSDEALAAAASGNTMAHEFGHTVGLGHVSNSNRIMFGSASATKSWVIETECTAYHRDNLSSNGGPAGENEPGDFSDVPIEDLAINGFHDTVPVEVEDYYDQDDVEILKQMLRDPDQAAHGRTIVSLIGLISDGSEDDVHAIADYGATAKRRDGHLVAVGLGLGYIASRTDSNEAMQSLLEMASANHRETRRGAAIGFGISGKTLGLSRLNALRAAAAQMRAADLTDDVLDHAIEDNHTVAELGLRGYYRHARP